TMCSGAAKVVHSRQTPPGPRETLSGSHKDWPAATLTAGMASVRRESGSNTRSSSRKGLTPLLVMLMALAMGEINSTAVTPAGNLPDAGLGMACACSSPSRLAHVRSRAASRRSAAVLERSSPLNPTAPLRKSDVGLAAQPAG